MKILRNINDLLGSIEIEIVFEEMHITQETVTSFGQLTGDVNIHNSTSTEKFQKAAVQGFLSLSLFAGFHKKVCQITGTDPVNVAVIETNFLRPIYVNDAVIPILTIRSTENHPTYIKTIWKYELKNSQNKRLIFALIELRYYYSNETTT